MNKDEAMQQALELIERLNKHGWILADFEAEVYAAITALKAALEQQAEPVGFEIAQPVAWRFKGPKDGHWLYTTHIVDLSKKYWRLKNELFEPLYTAPPPPLPVQEPTPWRDMVVVSLVREGVNKHKARELADHFAAQPVQEPVGEVTHVSDNGFQCEFNQRLAVGTKLYTTPPAVERPWVALTEQDMPSGEDPMFDHRYFCAGMVYAAKVLKEKNT